MRCCQTSTESPNAPAYEKATVPGMTKAAIRLRVMNNMIKKISTKAATATIADRMRCIP